MLKRGMAVRAGDEFEKFGVEIHRFFGEMGGF
jgi:hypothetical protein